jgi:hypothetical protein
MNEEIARLLSKRADSSRLGVGPLDMVRLHHVPVNPSFAVNLFDDNDFGLVLKKYEWVLNTFVYGNGFVGYDFFLLRYAADQLLRYEDLLCHEVLSKDLYRTCELELQTNFVGYLDSIYKIKEKIGTFVCWDQRTKSLGPSILNDRGRQSVSVEISSLYSRIQQHCEARGACVHDTYSLQYVREKQQVVVSCFAFTLSVDNTSNEASRRRLFPFDLGRTIVVDTIAAVRDSISKFLEIFSDLENIDENLLVGKFLTKRDGKTKFSISFG